MSSFLYGPWCITIGSFLAWKELGLDLESLWPTCYGFFSDTLPPPITSLCSGVWLESVSQWGRNQRVSLEAGDAGHPGPTAPGPVGQELRAQRGSATTPSKAWHEYLHSFLLYELGHYSRMAGH